MKFKASQPCSRRTRTVSSCALYVRLCLLLWFSIFISVWTGGAVTFFQIIPTGVNASIYFAEQDWLFLTLHFQCDFSVMHNSRNRISTALCERGLCIVAWLWATDWVRFSGWFVFIFSSWCFDLSQVPPVIISGFIALENMCAHRGCSAGTILWFTL